MGGKNFHAMTYGGSRAIEPVYYGNWSLYDDAGAWASTYQVGSNIAGSPHTGYANVISINGSRAIAVDGNVTNITSIGAWELYIKLVL